MKTHHIGIIEPSLWNDKTIIQALFILAQFQVKVRIILCNMSLMNQPEDSGGIVTNCCHSAAIQDASCKCTPVKKMEGLITVTS